MTKNKDKLTVYKTENVANKKVQDYVKKSHIIEENEPKSEKTTQDVQKNCSSLTEKWKQGKLKSGSYYLKLWSGATNSDFFNGGYFGYFFDEDIEEILAPVPSYEEWQSLNELVDCMSDTGKAFAHMLSPFTDDYFNGLTTKDIAELAKKSIRLTTQHCEDNAEIDKLKELLKECRDIVKENLEFSKSIGRNRIQPRNKRLLKRIDEVLK